MQQNKAPFFIIIGLAVLVVIGMIIASLFLVGSVGEVSPLQPRVDIEVVAASSIKPWAEQAADSYNRANPRTQVTIVEANDLAPEAQLRADGAQGNPPAGWLAEATFVVDMARNQGLQFDEGESVAGTHLAWGGYNNNLDAFTAEYGSLTWDNIHEKAISSEGFRLVIASPQNSAEGLAALMSATAAHLDKQTLSSSDIGSADAWLTDTLGNRNAQMPPTPAQSLASVQGRTLGEAALLSLASFRRANLDENGDFSILTASPDVTLDYPYAIYTGPGSTPELQKAARAFRDFLLESRQQSMLETYFFEPAGAQQNGVQIDGAGAARLQSWANRVLR